MSYNTWIIYNYVRDERMSKSITSTIIAWNYSI